MVEMSFAIDYNIPSKHGPTWSRRRKNKDKIRKRAKRKQQYNSLIKNQPSDSWDSLHKFRWKTCKGTSRFSIKTQRKQFNFQLKLRHPFSPYFEQIPAEQTATTIHPLSPIIPLHIRSSRISIAYNPNQSLVIDLSPQNPRKIPPFFLLLDLLFVHASYDPPRSSIRVKKKKTIEPLILSKTCSTRPPQPPLNARFFRFPVTTGQGKIKGTFLSIPRAIPREIGHRSSGWCNLWNKGETSRRMAPRVSRHQRARRVVKAQFSPLYTRTLFPYHCRAIFHAGNGQLPPAE